METTSTSPRFSLDKIDVKKIWTGAAVAVGGALLAYVTTVGFPEMNSAAWGTFLSAMFAVAVNALRKYVTDNPPFPLPKDPGATDEPKATTDK